MNPTVCTHKNNPNFWIFGLFFFLYFFIMATCFPFLPIWLSDVIGLNKTETGLVFSSLSLFAICFQPILGVISDKLGLKKHLMWIVTVLLVLIAPFFLYVFAPLLKTNIWLGALSGGAYIGFAFSAGAGAMEAYIERVSRNSGFEYGKARTFGCLGWALCATTAGMLFSINPEWVFWMGSAAALLLVVLVAIAKPQASQSAQVMDSLGANRPAIDLKRRCACSASVRCGCLFCMLSAWPACMTFSISSSPPSSNRSSRPRKRAPAPLVSPPPREKYVTPSLCSARRGLLTVSERRIPC